MSNNLDIVIVAMTGKLNSGKDHIARMELNIQRGQKYDIVENEVVGFAEELKNECKELYNLTFDQLYIEKDTNTRKILQEHGQKKREIDNQYWINKLTDKINNIINGYRNITYDKKSLLLIKITDIRFYNELLAIKNFERNQHIKKVLFIRVISPKRNMMKLIQYSEKECLSIMTHPSETNLDFLDNLDELVLKMSNIFIIYNDPEDKIDEVIQRIKKFIVS